MPCSLSIFSPQQVNMPRFLAFETWWHEGGKWGMSRARCTLAVIQLPHLHFGGVVYRLEHLAVPCTYPAMMAWLLAAGAQAQ